MKPDHYILFSVCFLATAFSQTTDIQYLSGTGSDHTVTWDFMCTQGRLSGQWSTIEVPSNWELQGFGQYNYGHDKNKGLEQGHYKTTFQVPESWQDKTINLVFDGVMTDTLVKVNGNQAGPVAKGTLQGQVHLYIQ